MRKVTSKASKTKPAVEEDEIVLDDAEAPFPPSNSTPEEVAEFFGDELPPQEAGRVVKMVYKTNRNRGNNEHESIELESTVAEGEDLAEVYDYLKETADYLLNG